MKIVGIVGSNAPFSHNRLLLQYIGYKFWQLFDLEILEITDVPLFNQSDDQTDNPVIQNLAHKIAAADGVIIATPEHNHTTSAALKSTIEWLSYQIHPFDGKPVMIVGASYYQQGSSRAQLHLRQILDSPGVNAMVLPGNEFLLGNAKEAFDSHYHLKNEATINFLGTCLENFVKYVGLVNGLNAPNEEILKPAGANESTPVSTDANSGASASWNASVAPVAKPITSNSTTPFDKTLDDIFGPDLGIEGKDILDTVALD
ncbi:FMN reductase [Streptococcus gallolyticus subsp. gallolyticus]|uniref:NADPH-dependent FMN reductase-like domain-containing protein n=2 Tax=Streptococcus gallolyticus TaxID=315405 RepID=A0AA36JY16_STRG3|nr:NAD(P)H-dependent oxidoreductase [Streptococcus sp.]OAV82506.1 FMN reductase [Streptococcus gallolyticus subsp. gallolyticus]QKI01597.1 NAD(P)H-dependent oxidoreductase [Streptococcus gallolyticus]QWX87667.1 NAD(P)H-dependent oxidoreductase [Streptococcus gallolyticus subsp. gallolyticus TX20005]CBI13387.1 conserved hypothetical protein [Streptococcus gallolyticus UCN34]